MSILNFFPKGKTPRPQQAALLRQLEEQWHLHEVFVIVAPTATGKTELAVTVANWQAAQGNGANIMPPTNVIVEQIEDRYPSLQALHRQDYYTCEPFKRDCGTTTKKCGRPCPDCPFVAAKKAARKAPVRLLNPYTAVSHKLYSPVAIFDEAHQLVDVIRETRDIKLWRSQYPYPTNFSTVAQVIVWGQDFLKQHSGSRDTMRLRATLSEIIRVRNSATVQYVPMRRNGQDDMILIVRPKRTKLAPGLLWPNGKVEKIVLMSATIGAGDIADMDLDSKRVLYLECESPIPAANRPLLFTPACNMGHKYTAYALPVLADRLRGLLGKHKEKGLIHLPYSLAEQLRPLMADARLMFHDRKNKAEVLDEFKNSPPAAGRVLVASGLYEGVDLPYDAARWQVIGKVPYLNLGDEHIKERADADPEWYAWQAVKNLLQAYGRIVRAADDYGQTYIFDNNFGRLYTQHRKLFPKFVRDAIKSI